MLRSLASLENLLHAAQRCALQTVNVNIVGPPGWWRGVASEASAAKVLLVYPREHSSPQVQEAAQLARTYAGEVCPALAAGSAKGFTHSAATFFGSGAIQDVKAFCSSDSFKRVFVNAQLSGVQLRNLEAAWGLPVLDRVGIIIEIFAQRARTREARLQVEMAALQYKASRLVRSVDARTGQRKGFGAGGQTEVVSARERGRSGGTSGGLGGASGGGETELQLQRRRIGTRIRALHRKLQEVRRTRQVQRSGRQRAGKPILGVVGYTSAGKSSLVTALSRKPLVARERLFETLDTTWASVYLPSGRMALASDTVGFISDLPHSLVSAFQATLEEVVEADVLLHVLDASSSRVAEQREAVYQVLRRLSISEDRLQNKLIEVWNKSDRLDPGALDWAPSSSREAKDIGGQTGVVHPPGSLEPSAQSKNAWSEDEQAAFAWKLAQDVRQRQGKLQPRAVVTSTATRQGLGLLLEEVDRMVSVRCAIDELKFGCSRFGPRVLNENVVGPPIKSAELRKALPGRLPRVQPLQHKHARRLAVWQS